MPKTLELYLVVSEWGTAYVVRSSGPEAARSLCAGGDGPGSDPGVRFEVRELAGDGEPGILVVGQTPSATHATAPGGGA